MNIFQWQYQKRLNEEMSKGFDEMYATMLSCNSEFEQIAKQLEPLEAEDLSDETREMWIRRYETARRRLLRAAHMARNFARIYNDIVAEPPATIQRHIKIADEMIAMCETSVESRLAAAVGK